jgi:hypothetical protein
MKVGTHEKLSALETGMKRLNEFQELMHFRLGFVERRVF